MSPNLEVIFKVSVVTIAITLMVKLLLSLPRYIKALPFLFSIPRCCRCGNELMKEEEDANEDRHPNFYVCWKCQNDTLYGVEPQGLVEIDRL